MGKGSFGGYLITTRLGQTLTMSLVTCCCWLKMSE